MNKLVRTIQGDENFIKLIQEKAVRFILCAGYTETAAIPGITVAGLPGFIEYTPALDMEVLYYGYPKSMPDIAKMPEGPPSPVLIAMAVRNLTELPASFIDTGLSIKPKCPHITLDSRPAGSVLSGADVAAGQLYEEGKRYAQEIRDTSDCFILSECVPGGTTTAYAVTRGLGYACDAMFSSSNFDPATYSLKRGVVDEALKNNSVDANDVFDVIAKLGDTMQPFVAGMAVELAKTRPVILGGGTQMAAVGAILAKVPDAVNYANLALITTKWIVDDGQSDIAALLAMVNPELNAFYADFDFSGTGFKNLALYDEGYVKEGIGAGSVIAHAYLKGVDKTAIRKGVETIYGAFGA